MDDTSTLEIIGWVALLARDIAVVFAVFWSVLSLLDKRDLGNALYAWIVGLIGMVASVVIDDSISLLGIPDSIIVLGLVISAVLIMVGMRKGRGSRRSKRRKASNGRSDKFPYHRRDALLTPAENAFYQVVIGAVGRQATICPKVGLWDIFHVEDLSKDFGAKSRIDRKHVDFLLCDPKTMEPLVAVELDDSSHNRSDRRQRDQFVDQVFDQADLPLVHIRVRREYSAGELLKTLAPYLTNGHQEPAYTAPPAQITVTADHKPLCPKCGTPMVIRIAKRGPNQGQQFYACPNYPECRSVIPLKP